MKIQTTEIITHNIPRRVGRERDYQREYMREYRKDKIKKAEEQKRDRARKKGIKNYCDKQFQEKIIMIKQRAEIINQRLTA